MRVLARRARRRGWILAALVVVASTSCRTRAGDGTKTPRYLGDFRGAPTEVDPAFAEQWTALQDAMTADAGSAETAAAADRLLSAGPPFELRLWGVHAKAQHAYVNGDDAGAISMVDQVLAASSAESPPDAVSALALVRARALVRSGDAARGLAALDEPALRREGVLIPTEDAALRAIALDRAGRPEALAALVRWRASIGPDVDDAATAFAQRRAAALATTLGPKATALAAAAEQGAARTCLEGLAGLGVPDDAAPWIRKCRAAPRKVGVLLPRTGPLAALADTQLAAATASVALLAPSHPQIGQVLWHDSGADATSAAEGASALVAEGATVIVGPIGPAAVRAVRARVGASIRVLTPGEPVGEVSGVAPTLERRVAALVDVAKARGAKRVIVFAPDSTYGKRAQGAAVARLGKTNAPIVVVYPPNTTSFSSFTDPLAASLDAKTAVIVADHASRTEMLVRQLARDGKGPASKNGPLFLATAEGISDVEAGAGHDVLANMVVAPTAATTAEAESFADAYRSAEGVPPPDQALLVHRALRIAYAGDEAGEAPVVLVKVQGGKLVVQAAP